MITENILKLLIDIIGLLMTPLMALLNPILEALSPLLDSMFTFIGHMLSFFTVFVPPHVVKIVLVFIPSVWGLRIIVRLYSWVIGLIRGGS